MQYTMKNTKQINQLLASFMQNYPQTDINEQLWDIAMSLLFSKDFQEWTPSDQYGAINMLRNLGMLFNRIKVLTN